MRCHRDRRRPPSRVLASLNTLGRSYELDGEIVGLVARRLAPMDEVPTYRPPTRREGKRIGMRDGLAVQWTIVVFRVRRVLAQWAL